MEDKIIENNFKIIEKNLEKNDSIISSCFVLDDNGKIEEIHIVSNGKRPAKQLSRDIKSILIASYNIDVDYKKISIAELPKMKLEKKFPRLKLEGISYESNIQKASVKVNLSENGNIYTHSENGINTSRNIERMLVNSTLKSVEKALNVEDMFILEDIKTVQFSADNVVLVIIIYILDGEEKRMCGSSFIKNDYRQSVVKSTLDAINKCILK